jgi:hypothetical protein
MSPETIHLLVRADDLGMSHAVNQACMGEARELGALGREHVRKDYLITRLLADELKLLASVA